MTLFTLDTNVLIYSIDVADARRCAVADRIVRRAAQSTALLTVQSISEFYAAVVRKRLMDRRLAAEQAEDWLATFPIASASAAAIRAAMFVAGAGRASYWDALLVATAAEAGCTAILTEDMADGSILLGVRIVNPFEGARLSAAAEALLAA